MFLRRTSILLLEAHPTLLKKKSAVNRMPDERFNLNTDFANR